MSTKTALRFGAVSPIIKASCFLREGIFLQAYLFAHFREKTTPDGEQVRFALSTDGFQWEAVNQGQPVLWSYVGEHGTRDYTIVRHPESGIFYLLGTDLSIAYGVRRIGTHRFWDEVSEQGSRNLVIWASADLVHWSESTLLPIDRRDFGCVWAPDALYDPQTGEFVLHWSSSVRKDGYRRKRIFYSRTRDFTHLTTPKTLYEDPDHDVIDSALYEEKGRYYLFVKVGQPLSRPRLLVSDTITGPFTPVEAFDRSMTAIDAGVYEAPTAVRLEDGRWCLFLDFYGAKGAKQGYVPFVAQSLASGEFIRADEQFSFPYGFKHGTILPITGAEYDRIRSFDWSDPGYDW